VARFSEEWLIDYQMKHQKEIRVHYDSDEGPESSLQKKIMDHCEMKGWRVFHDRSRRRNQRGWPDVFLYLPDGKHLLIELKSADGTLRKEQKHLKMVLKWLGHEVYVVRSFKKFLEIVNNV